MTRTLAVLAIALAVLLSMPALLRAQSDQAIHGVVIAKADQTTLPDTLVRLEGPTLPVPLQTTTGPDGHFAFQRIIPGDYILTLVHNNFSDERLQFTLKPRELKNLTVEMTIQPVSTEVQVKG